MLSPMPPCSRCGRALERRYAPPAVHYRAAGFYSTDVDRLRREIGPERFARFEAQRAEAERRARRGQLTAHERRLEQLGRMNGEWRMTASRDE